jgi:hypothetical protein
MRGLWRTIKKSNSHPKVAYSVAFSASPDPVDTQERRP